MVVVETKKFQTKDGKKSKEPETFEIHKPYLAKNPLTRLAKDGEDEDD